MMGGRGTALICTGKIKGRRRHSESDALENPLTQPELQLNNKGEIISRMLESLQRGELPTPDNLR